MSIQTAPEHTIPEIRKVAARPPDWSRDLTLPLIHSVQTIERDARRQQRTVPSLAERDVVASEFWQLMARLRTLPNTEPNRDALQRAIHPLFLRAATWNRSFVKPHGYAGDFRLLEQMYDLEGSSFADPTRGLVENLLDAVFSTVHSVRAVWHRRAAFRDLVLESAWSEPGPVRVLDVAGGGARYLLDAALLLDDPSRLRITLVDQDPAALAFAAPRLRAAGAQVSTVCTRIRSLRTGDLPETQYDVVVSTGLFDYLPDAEARALLSTMDALCAPGGVVSLGNSSPADPSRVVKDWVVDWSLIYRDAPELAALWPVGPAPDHLISPDGSLVYSTRRV